MFGFQPLAGEHWGYRKGESAPFEHVEIVEVTVEGRKQRAKLRFVDDGNRIESVPLARLRTPWEHVDAYRQYILDWDQLGALELDRVEESAIEEVSMTLVPESVARIYGGRIHYVTAVRDVAAFEQLVGVSVDAIIDQCFSCVQDGVRLVGLGAALGVSVGGADGVESAVVDGGATVTVRTVEVVETTVTGAAAGVVLPESSATTVDRTATATTRTATIASKNRSGRDGSRETSESFTSHVLP